MNLKTPLGIDIKLYKWYHTLIMSTPNFDNEPQISADDQMVLQDRFKEISPSLDVVTFAAYPGDGKEDTGSIDVNAEAHFQFDRVSVLVSINETIGSGYHQIEQRVQRYKEPTVSAQGRQERTVETFAIERSDDYDPQNSSDDPDAGETTVDHLYSKKTQRWVALDAPDTGYWEDKDISEDLKSVDENGLPVYHFEFGQDAFEELMGTLDRALDSEKVPRDAANPGS